MYSGFFYFNNFCFMLASHPMVKNITKIISLFTLFVVFVSTNHCIVEELSAKNTDSHCSPIGNSTDQSDNHPHGTPCLKIVSLANRLQPELSLKIDVLTPVLKSYLIFYQPVIIEIFTQISTLKMPPQNLLVLFLFISPNAPPIR